MNASCWKINLHARLTIMAFNYGLILNYHNTWMDKKDSFNVYCLE